MLSHALTILCETSAWTRLRALYIAPLLIALFTFAGCGGGSGDGQPPVANPGCDAATCGTLLVGLTDADGDFLLRANGDTVETLPVRQRVDFAELVDLRDT